MANLTTGCKTAIHRWATPETQANASLFGEHADFVRLVIQSYRAHYLHLVQTGATEWSDDEKIEAYLAQVCPWETE